MRDKAKVRIGRLNTVGDGGGEMGRVYRQARRDELDDRKAARLVGMFAEIRHALEFDELVRRIGTLPSAVPSPRAWSRI